MPHNRNLLKAYKIPVKDKMIVKHGSQVRVVVKSKEGVLSDNLTAVETIGGAYTVACVMYNRLAMSGGISWWNPESGRPISRPRVYFYARKEDIVDREDHIGGTDRS